MTVTLRPYQEETVAAHWSFFESNPTGNPLFVVPTAGGKSHIMAAFLKRSLEAWPETRALIVTHVKELIRQNHDKMVAHYGGAFAPTGIYSAGLARRDTQDRLLFAGIQSICSRPEELGWFDLVLVDECHLIPKKGQGRYRTYLEALHEINPNVRVIGYTATPFRLDGGYLHKGKGRIFTDVAHTVEIEQLVTEGYISKIVAKRPSAGIIDTAGVHTATGDFKKDELEKAAMDSDVEAAVKEMVERGSDRKRWIVFGCGLDHAAEICRELKRHGVTYQSVFGHTKRSERDATIAAFKDGAFRCMVNVGVLTTGFDAVIDMIALMRPTKSPGLYVQIVGRGCRIDGSDGQVIGKQDCLLLDYGGNVERHGPVNRVKVKQPNETGLVVVKVCPACESYVLAGARTCPDCGYEFPEPEQEGGMHDRQASDLKPMDFEPPVTRWWLDVSSVHYRFWSKPGKVPTLRVDYLCGMKTISEWVCLEHSGYALTKARRWWRARADRKPAGVMSEVPSTVLDALERQDELSCPAQIEVKKEGDRGQFKRIVGIRWVAKPAQAD